MQSETPHAICGAKTRSGGTCKQKGMPNGRCRMHGGKSLSGIASPTYKTGRYSKHLPARLQERYSEALADDDLISIRDDVALVEARLADLLGRVDTGESGRAWFKAREAFNAFDKETNPDLAIKHLVELRAALGEGTTDYGAWAEVKDLLEQRRRLVADERKHVLETGRIITIEQLMLWVGALLAEIRSAVIAAIEDEQLRRRVLSGVQSAFTKLATTGERPGRALPEPGGTVSSGREPVDVQG